MAGTNKVKFKTNKPITLPVQTKTWGLHEAVDMNYEEVFKLLAGGAEDIMMVSDDGTETPITWDNLETYFPKEDEVVEGSATTLEGDFFVENQMDESFGGFAEDEYFQVEQEEPPMYEPSVEVDPDMMVDHETIIPDETESSEEVDSEMSVDPEVIVEGDGSPDESFGGFAGDVFNLDDTTVEA